MTSLKEKYENYFLIGAAVNHKVIDSHKEIITKHFNSITCENEMKYANVCKEKEKYNFTYADKIVSFARENKLALRGHTFVWHNQTPEWVFSEVNKEELRFRLRKHMETLGGRYHNDIFCWDVVNEAIEDKENTRIRTSGWSKILGENFMDDAFLIAKELFPNTSLFYNDYNETDPIKRDKIYSTIYDMKERGIPIDGLGLQCHINIYSANVDNLRRTLELYAKLGLRLHITEMDVSLFEFVDSSKIEKPSDKMLEKQAIVYAQYFKAFREYKDIIDCVTTWGVADDDTWLDNFPFENRKNWPLLFDEEHNPKEALLRIMDF
ncbi:MAG: Endo,4-beta-xylanase [Anaerocolumna sp.]|jgi:endo-1,4-beta-xylanase|nr:Endo,4-beta-xylanase [Anaerocolumna sp.]